MLATLIGWKVAGWAGAAIATLALFVSSSLLTFAVVRAGRVSTGTGSGPLLGFQKGPLIGR